jgi:hypothetical protein
MHMVIEGTDSNKQLLVGRRTTGPVKLVSATRHLEQYYVHHPEKQLPLEQFLRVYRAERLYTKSQHRV